MGIALTKGNSSDWRPLQTERGRQATSPPQNWILDPLRDCLFIIAAPCIVLVLALGAFRALGAGAATALVLGVHVVFTVAHHLPTFIRIYGDVDLMRRFKWNLLLAPLVPVTFSLGVLGYVNYKGYPVEYFLYLYLLLALWDPWHFLRQHYGFMRIYDRNNAAPRRITARMDLTLCVVCFVFILLASGSWLPAMLADLYSSAKLPILLAVSARTLDVLTYCAGCAALATVTAYGVYLYWCWRRGYFISVAKIALFASTFGVLYLAYTPNPWVLHAAPGWTFKVGFAAVGLVHMTQYLAIVWRYNRGLAERAERARAGLFRSLHMRGGWLTGGAYVALCLIYGDLLTTRYDSRWLMTVLLALGFTSTLTHYYYDGFIWKVRHRQNDENLGSSSAGYHGAASADGLSWWNGVAVRSASAVLLRQIAYFGIPMGVLTFGAVTVWSRQTDSYVQHMYRAQQLEGFNRDREARNEARLAFAAMQEQLPYARRLAELQPTSAREAELAFLVYNYSHYAYSVIPALNATRTGVSEIARRYADVGEAIDLLQDALDRGGPVAHSGRDRLAAGDARRVLYGWQRTAAELQSRLRNGASPR